MYLKYPPSFTVVELNILACYPN